MTDTTKTRMTAAEFAQLPQTNTPTELIDGEVIVSPSPEPVHQDTVLNTAGVLKQAAKQHGAGGKVFVAPLDVYLDEQNTPQPDVMWLAPNSQCVIGEKKLIGAPDLIVEVLSPGSNRMDKREKFRLYERHGVREYWIINPREQLVEVWQSDAGKFVLLDVYSSGESFVSSLLGTIDVTAIFSE